MHTGMLQAHQLTRDFHINNKQIQWLSHPNQREGSGRARPLDLAIMRLEVFLEDEMGHLIEEGLVPESYQMLDYR